MAKIMKERAIKKVKPKRLLRIKKLKRNRKLTKKKKKDDEKKEQNRGKLEKKREDTYFSFEDYFKKIDIKKNFFNLNYKVINKMSYSFERPLKENIDDKNVLFKNRKQDYKKIIFANNFKYMKGKILIFYINIIILIILYFRINSSYIIQLTIPGPGISKVFYENPGDSLYYCPPAPTFPQEVFINNIKQKNKTSEYYLNDIENIIRLEYANSNLNFM